MESLQVEITRRERHEHCPWPLQYEVTHVLADSNRHFPKRSNQPNSTDVLPEQWNWDTGRLWTVNRSAKVLRLRRRLEFRQG